MYNEINNSQDKKLNYMEKAIDFVHAVKNLTRYRSKNKFVELAK